MEQSAGQEQRTKQQERAERILDVAAEQLLRWGYKRVTIEDIAKQAEVGTGTLYLHWKNKEAIFESVLLREAVAIWRALLQSIQADAREALLHRFMRTLFLLIRKRPLARALFTQDSTVLGKLAGGTSTIQPKQAMNAQEFLVFLRTLGLLRTESSLSMQAYAFSATLTGFLLVDPLLIEEDQSSLEEKADALAQTIRLAFDPEILPSLEELQEHVVPRLTTLLEQVCAYYEQQMYECIARSERTKH